MVVIECNARVNHGFGVFRVPLGAFVLRLIQLTIPEVGLVLTCSMRPRGLNA